MEDEIIQTVDAVLDSLEDARQKIEGILRKQPRLSDERRLREADEAVATACELLNQTADDAFRRKREFERDRRRRLRGL